MQKMVYSCMMAAALCASEKTADMKQTTTFETISVTATKVERATKEVAESISVLDSFGIDDRQIDNIAHATGDMAGVFAVSNNGGYDARMIIRGAGLKAPYGVREIMVVRDGVPMTDPDSFSRFDFIDMQDVERVEVTKGPGSLLASNATGGVIQLLSKSVFENDESRVKLGFGSQGASMMHGRAWAELGEKDVLALTFSQRAARNEWRHHNRYDNVNISVKHGHRFEEGTLESEVSYSIANMEIPGSVDKEGFATYKKTGKQEKSASAWRHSARDSKILFFNTRYITQMGSTTFKPRFYMNRWEHFHPVTGFVNDKVGNSVYGTDLEWHVPHNSTLVTGVSGRYEDGKDGKKYTYRDVATIPSGRIVGTLSEAKGDLARTEDTQNALYGVYAQESMQLTPAWNLDLVVRFDTLDLDIEGEEYIKYDYSKGTYKALAAPREYEVDERFGLQTFKIASSYAITTTSNLFALIGRADQAPTDNEVSKNLDYGGPDLDVATATNYEIGLKHRSEGLSADVSIYNIIVDDEIVAVPSGYTTIYKNAGKTDKKGFELSLAYEVLEGLSLGGNYTYSDYTFDTFKEVVSGQLIDRSGNQLPFIPKNHYSLFANYHDAGGVKARIQAQTWGEYYMDNANTEKYDGYTFVTSLMLGYSVGMQSLQLNIENLFDLRYASEAQKDARGTYYYDTAAPRRAMVTYTHTF